MCFLLWWTFFHYKLLLSCPCLEWFCSCAAVGTKKRSMTSKHLLLQRQRRVVTGIHVMGLGGVVGILQRVGWQWHASDLQSWWSCHLAVCVISQTLLFSGNNLMVTCLSLTLSFEVWHISDFCLYFATEHSWCVSSFFSWPLDFWTINISQENARLWSHCSETGHNSAFCLFCSRLLFFFYSYHVQHLESCETREIARDSHKSVLQALSYIA